MLPRRYGNGCLRGWGHGDVANVVCGDAVVCVLLHNNGNQCHPTQHYQHNLLLINYSNNTEHVLCLLKVISIHFIDYVYIITVTTTVT